MRTYTIDCLKWRSGPIATQTRKNKLGRGKGGKMLNGQGYMCCLGFCAKQDGAINMLGEMMPEDVEWPKMDFMSEDRTPLLTVGGDDSEFAVDAAEINDANISLDERIKRLRALAAKHDIKLKFKNLSKVK